MNFKSIGLNVAAATVTMAGAALVSSPAQALSFNRGTFDLGGTTGISDISNRAGQVSSFTFSFQNFVIGNTTKSMAGGTLTGTPSLLSLSLTRTGNSFTTASGVQNFLTGLKYKGESVFLDITNAITFTGTVQNQNQYALTATNLAAVFRTANGSLSSDSIVSSLTASRSGGRSGTGSLSVDVPTPALLPGLVGLGVAALRKRKSEATKDALAKA